MIKLYLNWTNIPRNRKQDMLFDTLFTFTGLTLPPNIQGRFLFILLGFNYKARGHLRKDDCPHTHPHKSVKIHIFNVFLLTSIWGQFGIGRMNLRRRKPRRCFPLTLGPLDPGTLGNEGEVGFVMICFLPFS